MHIYIYILYRHMCTYISLHMHMNHMKTIEACSVDVFGSSQVGFIEFVITPLAEQMVRFHGNVSGFLV